VSAGVFGFCGNDFVGFFAKVEDLVFFAAVAVDGDSFAFEFVGKQVRFADIFRCCFGR